MESDKTSQEQNNVLEISVKFQEILALLKEIEHLTENKENFDSYGKL